MQNEEWMQMEKQALERLSEAEDLAEKKMKIYARLLTDAALAEDMESLAVKHAERKTTLKSLACGKNEKCEKRKKNVDRYEVNGQEEEE